MSSGWTRPGMVRRWHRWLGLIVGVQLFLWTVSGLYFTLFAIERVRGEDRLIERVSAPVDATTVLPLSQVLELATGSATTTVQRAELRRVRDRPAYLLQRGLEPMVLDATTGEALPTMTEDEVRRHAPTLYQGAPAVLDVQWITRTGGEYKDQVPAWRVALDDGRGTALYLDPVTGAVRKVRNRVWRVFDFLWSLHIMDYKDRTDFHHPLLIVAAALGVLTSCTGLWLELSYLRTRFRR